MVEDYDATIAVEASANVRVTVSECWFWP